MLKTLDPFRLVLMPVAGWMNQEQQHGIQYLREENRVLRAQLGNRRLRLTDDQRRALAAKARLLGRKMLSELATIVTPETLLRWHLRIQGALSNPDHELARSTIANILKRNGIEPSPERARKTTWKEFLAQHWELIVAADFFTVEVWTRKGLPRFMVLFFIEVSSRRVQIAGIAATADAFRMSQIARNLTDAADGLLKGKRYLIHDRDPLFTSEFLSLLAQVGTASVKLPPRSPNLNSYAERFVRIIVSCAL
jgi:putative transposase